MVQGEGAKLGSQVSHAFCSIQRHVESDPNSVTWTPPYEAHASWSWGWNSGRRQGVSPSTMAGLPAVTHHPLTTHQA